jgi:hypothetical protein
MADSAILLLSISYPYFLLRIRSLRELGIIAALSVLIVLAMTLREKWRKYRTRKWPRCAGRITSLKLSKVDGGFNGVDYWKVVLDYSYYVLQEHNRSYSFNCASEHMGESAVAGLTGKAVSVHYHPSNENKSLLWEDEVWDIWWDTYWNSDKPETAVTPQ